MAVEGKIGFYFQLCSKVSHSQNVFVVYLRVFQHLDQWTYCHETFYKYYTISTRYVSISCNNNNMVDVTIGVILSVMC